MTQPENFTAAQASDPTTPGQVLADIAALRPDLRAAVASNPSAYPGLLEWLTSLGDPTVDAAIAARRAPAAPQAPVQTPPAPQGVQAPPAPQWAQQPTYTAPPASMPAANLPPASLPPQGAAPYGPPQGAVPYGAPQAGPQGVPQYGAPQAPYGAPQGQQYGAPPQGGLQYGAPPAKKSNKALWIILIIVGVLVLIGGGIAWAIATFVNETKDIIDEGIDIVSSFDPSVPGGNYGDDPALDALWDACDGGDWQACDDLFGDSPLDSEYENFGDTCGNRQAPGSGEYCVDTQG